MQRAHTLKIAIRTPDAGSRAELVDVLGKEDAFDVVDERDHQRDIELVDFRLIRELHASLPLVNRNIRIVAVFAPNDPARLATLLVSGVRGYHCRGESWNQLLSVLHTVGEGGVRTDPRTMNELLLIYRRMLQNLDDYIPPNWHC